MKRKKKPVSVKWAKVTNGGDPTASGYAVWIGNAIVGWETSEERAVIRVNDANAELSRLVAARDRRMK